MSSDPDPDPGGQNPNIKAHSSRELTDLRDQNEQQLVLIAQLKEMLRKEQSTVSQEKVEEYVNTLNKVKAKRSKQKRDDPSSSGRASISSVNIDANKKERINLLRQQLEENKARLAERGKSQKGIEEMVTQLQAQFKDSQTFISSTPLNVALTESKSFDYNENTPQKDLYNILLIKEKKITELLNKSQKLESSILDLQENLKEKDSVIDARTKAITLMTDSLSKKGKNTLDALEETKEQMRKMQENFVTLEGEMKARQLTLLNDLKMKNLEIADLQQVNSQFEKDKLELEKQACEHERDILNGTQIHSLTEEFQKVQEEKVALADKINQLENMVSKFESENSDNLLKISHLEKQLEETVLKLQAQNKTAEDDTEGLIWKEENTKISRENEVLKEENSKNLSRIAELEGSLKEALTDLDTVKDTSEITKLKKQLDESNKNEIKIRAMQKGKIKELNKRLEQFKKMNDANALIVELQNENYKLNEKITELEDEKGNLQLKMVESTTSSKGDSAEMEEHIKQIENQLQKTTFELDEKDKEIDNLESEVLSLKADLKQKNEEEVKVSTQVSSEMSLIQYEEQIEKIETEKKKLQEEIDTLKVEKEDLLEKVEVLTKEKQDLSSKLDSYIQENMELIDKLEKLSAEKVSSVESIEIVEGLTQQEKIELAAYQKHINPEEPLKCSEDDSLDPPVELNESVLQLSEDTVELLQKIEMFTQERKEVMQKMESLKDQNELLRLKVKEIENNRDILEETYEQLQNEKGTLITEKQQLLEQLENIDKVDKQKEDEQFAKLLDEKLKELQGRNEALVMENEELKIKLTQFNLVNEENDEIKSKILAVSEENNNLRLKLEKSSEEIDTFKAACEETKNEFINSSDLINNLRSKIEEREKDIDDLNKNIQDLNDVINDLQMRNSNYEHMELELSNLNSTLAEQMAQTVEYQKGVALNSGTIDRLNQELQEMNRRIFESENDLEFKNSEIQKLTKDIVNKEGIIRNLQTAIEEKDQTFKTMNEEIKHRYLGLQQQLENNELSVQRQIKELSDKNKEQLEKMKKIAANLKKKIQAYQELEERYNNEKEKWEIELKEKEVTLQAADQRIIFLTKEIKEIENHLKIKLEENDVIRKEIILLKEEIEDLQQNNADQENYIIELKQKQEKLTEVSLQQEMSASLHEEINSSFSQDVTEEKIRGLELLLETNESELNHYKHRVAKFEESVRKLEEEKGALEIKNIELSEKLDVTSNSFNEKTLLLNQLEVRLAEVTTNAEVLTKKLHETQTEHEELIKKNHEQEELIKKLKIKLKKAHDKVTELKALHFNYQELENINLELKRQIANLEMNQRHIQNENESLQKRNMSDYEKIEADYQIQLEELLKAKNDLIIENEKLLEKVKEFEDREQELNIEMSECKIRLEQSEKNYNESVNKLTHELNMSKDNMDLIESENHSLRGELKDINEKLQCFLKEIENYNKSGNLNEPAIDSDDLKIQLEKFSEKDHLSASLFRVNEALRLSFTEKEELQQQIYCANEKLRMSEMQVGNLQIEIDKLNQHTQALEFAKSTLEASCESLHKLDNTIEMKQPIVLEDLNKKYIKHDQGSVPTFHWPNQEESHQATRLFDNLPPFDNDNIFDIIVSKPLEEKQVFSQAIQEGNQHQQSAIFDTASNSESQPFSPIIENGREALLKKIKVLEFLLYNIDKEKEIALEQCTSMVNELTQLICQEGSTASQSAALDLESQIMSEKDINNFVTNKQVLQQMECAPVDKSSGEQPIPVEEDLIEPKKAYICFDDDENLPTKKDRTAEKTNTSVESQIISEADINAARNKRDLQKLEYQHVDKSIGPQQQPVVEPVAQAKQAYLCYTKDDKPQSLEAFEENDDGWGWGPEEAKLEEEYMTNVENTPQVKNLLLEVQQLKENIKVLQVERENYLEEIRQLQIKSGKLIKKCKELKSKNDQANVHKKSDDGGFFDLNETIQEEFKNQIQLLEKKLKEVNSDFEKEKIEKSGLLKKVDVLTSANEKMVEMKEIQDAEIFRLQRKQEEAIQKAQDYDWGNDGFTEISKPTSNKQPSVSESVKVQELEHIIRDLTLDNEELQALLEEQTARRLAAEKNKLSGSEQEITELRMINEKHQKEINEFSLNCSEIKNELHQAQDQNNKLNEDMIELKQLLDQKEIQVQQLEETIRTLGDQRSLDSLQIEMSVLKQQLEEQHIVNQEKQRTIDDLQTTLMHLNDAKAELHQVIVQQNNDLDSRLHKIEQLQLAINQNDDTNTEMIKDLNEMLDNLKIENKILEEKQVQCNNSLHAKDEEIKKFLLEKSEKELEYKNILDDLHSKIKELENSEEFTNGLQSKVGELESFKIDKIEELKTKSFEIDQKQRLIEELTLKIKDHDTEKLIENLDSKTKELEKLTLEKSSKDIEIDRLLKEIHNKEQQFEERISTLINELNESWQIQVDQRGTDVAESWKIHLESVEKDYMSVQETLKSNIVKLEEKCNILVQENNELRNNVNNEINSEIDKLSALQQEIFNNQQTISALNCTLQEKEQQINEIQGKLTNYSILQNELEVLKADNVEKENKLASINIVIETTQKQFDEKREVIEEIVSILENNASNPISYEKQDILNEFQRQLNFNNQKDNEILKLTQNVNHLESNLNRISGEKNREISGLNQVIEDLEKELSVIHEKETEIVRLSTELSCFQQEKGNLQNQLMEIQQEKDNLNQELQKLKQDHTNCLQIMENYKEKVEEYSNAQIILQQNLEEKDVLINMLNQKLSYVQEESKNDSNKEIDRLNSDISKAKEDYMAIEVKLQECQAQLYQVTQQMTQKSEELETATQTLQYYQQSYTAYEVEVNRLKHILEQREKEYSSSLELLKNNQLADVQRHYDELLSNKDVDKHMLQAQVQELLNANKEYNERLSQELSSKQDLEEKLQENIQLIDEDTKQLEELKLIIEDQVASIEQLKKQLFDKSNQYDSLIAEMDLGRQPVTQQPSASTAMNTPSTEKSQYVEDDLTEPVSRAELDLALYMLHQRDVRCEELTVELTQLLEERDTLQLRLSNAIREKEELRKRISDDTASPSPDKGSSTPRSKSSQIFLAASGTELAKEPLESDQNLASKLSELKNVGYKKDKTFVDEQEARRLQQLSIMQQHINEASKLPPEAAAKLVDASYTLSRDVQSPSKVLLNWLWGKNPPKANDS